MIEFHFWLENWTYEIWYIKKNQFCLEKSLSKIRMIFR